MIATAALARARSLLFAPGDDERKLLGAAEAGADAVIADLEDGVGPPAREGARANIEAAFAGEPGEVLRCVRINPPGTPDHERDVQLVRGLTGAVVVLPKATPAAVEAVAEWLRSWRSSRARRGWTARASWRRTGPSRRSRSATST